MKQKYCRNRNKTETAIFDLIQERRTRSHELNLKQTVTEHCDQISTALDAVVQEAETEKLPQRQQGNEQFILS